jgi:hypothetical protein
MTASSMVIGAIILLFLTRQPTRTAMDRPSALTPHLGPTLSPSLLPPPLTTIE